jgi:pilus assembly protein Flp/PilA
MKRIWERTEGQGLVEYSLILILVAVVVIAALRLVGPATGNIFSVVVDALTYDEADPVLDPPPECYGSLLLPAMIGVTGLWAGLSCLLPKKPAEEPVD